MYRIATSSIQRIRAPHQASIVRPLSLFQASSFSSFNCALSKREENHFHHVTNHAFTTSSSPSSSPTSTFASIVQKEEKSTNSNDNENSDSTIRLSKLIAQRGMNMQMSRKSAESIISSGQVTIAGNVVTNPSLKVNISLNDSNGSISNDYDVLRSIKVAGRHFILDTGGMGGRTNSANTRNQSSSNIATSAADTTNHAVTKSNDTTTKLSCSLSSIKTRVWLVHKLKGELVAEHDPLGRPSLMERLYRGGVGKSKKNNNKARVHLKPVGRLDMTTEGLILVTNDGLYAREMTLPSNKIQRTYRVRVHGLMALQSRN